MLQDAWVRQLEVLGEASTRVSQDFVQSNSDWPWRQMRSMRNVLIHGYDTVDLDDVWATIQNDRPGVCRRIEKALG